MNWGVDGIWGWISFYRFCPFSLPLSSLLGLRLLRRMKLKTTPPYFRIVTIKAHFAIYASRVPKVLTFPRGHGS